jgi:MurNAc alpha-1-phosphate uridylyltransferase
LLGDAFFVLYGDSYLTCDFHDVQERFISAGKSGLMTVFRNDMRWDVSNVEFDGERILDYSKTARTGAMRYIDYGLGVLRAHAVHSVPTDAPSDLAELYQQLLSRNDLAGYEITQRFYEIGSPEGLAETRALLASAGKVRGDVGS